MTHAPASPQHAVYGYGGVVSAGGPLAATAGLGVLQRGGNAVDAVIAAAFVQSVVEFPWGGVGGDAFVLVRSPDGSVHAVNGSGAAPIKLGSVLTDGQTISRYGPTSMSVPGFTAAIELLHGRFGSASFADLVEPAIRYAADGFAVTPELATALGRIDSAVDPASGLGALIRANQPAVGSRFRHPRLAETLRGIASGGARYFSEVAGERLAGWITSNGGALSADDFVSHTVGWSEPMSIRYGSLTVHTHPPVSMGGVLLQELALYERLGLPYAGPIDAVRIDAMVRCKHAAFARWTAAMADPALHHPEGPEHSQALRSVLLDADELDRVADRLLTVPVSELRRARPDGDGSDTTCVVAADRDGYQAAVIHSLFNEFGSRELDPETGILLNDRLANQRYALDPADGLAAGDRPQHTLNVVCVDDDRGASMMLATPGGRGQVQTSFQVIVNVFDGGLDLQQGIDAPRWLSGAPRRPEPNDHLFLEPAFPVGLRNELAVLGHRTAEPDEVSSDLFGSCVAVGRSDRGALYAAADHRREARTATF